MKKKIGDYIRRCAETSKTNKDVNMERTVILHIPLNN